MRDAGIMALVDRARAGTADERYWAVSDLLKRLRFSDVDLLGEVLSIAIRDPYDATRELAAENLGDPELVRWHDGLLDALRNDPDTTVRACAAESIGDAGNRDGINALKEALRDEAAEVRAYAARSLGVIGGPDDAEILRDRLTTEASSARYDIMGALCRLQGREEPLRSFMRNLGEVPEDEATQALSVLEDMLLRATPVTLKPGQADMLEVLDTLRNRLSWVHQGHIQKLRTLLCELS